MTEKSWRLDRLGALADEWMAEREIFLSSMHAYLYSHLQHNTQPTLQALTPAIYAHDSAAMSKRLCDFVRKMEGTAWYSLRSPERMSAFQHEIDDAFGAAATADAQRLGELEPPPEYAAAHDALRRAIGLEHHILQILKELQGQSEFGVLLFTRRLVSQIKYLLYPVRHRLPVWQAYWLLDDVDVSTCEPAEPHPASGIQRCDSEEHRGVYSSYVPEYYSADHTWPLILSMHGGSGNDEDFLWTWLKYAKSRGYLLISAKSFGPTWHAWDTDSVLLILEDMQARYNVDPSRILLTGLSDGGSFAYEVGFAHPERFTGLAVVAGILRPHHRSPQASQLPVYIAHGEQDQLFPIAFIRAVARNLREWGHGVTYHEIPGFGHSYPPGANEAILDWFTTQSAAGSPS
jgi:phospholipase/carboxylesterase